jgi:hypothetical protein
MCTIADDVCLLTVGGARSGDSAEVETEKDALSEVALLEAVLPEVVFLEAALFEEGLKVTPLVVQDRAASPAACRHPSQPRGSTTWRHHVRHHVALSQQVLRLAHRLRSSRLMFRPTKMTTSTPTLLTAMTTPTPTNPKAAATASGISKTMYQP